MSLFLKEVRENSNIEQNDRTEQYGNSNTIQTSIDSYLIKVVNIELITFLVLSALFLVKVLCEGKGIENTVSTVENKNYAYGIS